MQHGAAAELLARAPLFRGIGGELLTAILQGGELKRYSAGQVLAIAGTPAESTLFIIDGEVGLKDDARVCGGLLEAGSFLNQIAMFVETNNLFNAVALTDVTAVSLDADFMGRLLFWQPHLAGVFADNIKTNLAKMADTLRQLDRELEESLSNLPQPEEEVEELSADIGHEGEAAQTKELEANVPFAQILSGRAESGAGPQISGDEAAVAAHIFDADEAEGGGEDLAAPDQRADRSKLARTGT